MIRGDDRALANAAYEAWDAGTWVVAGKALERLLQRRPNHRRAAVWWYDAEVPGLLERWRAAAPQRRAWVAG